MKPVITAYDWVPPFARGHVRDLRVRWALEEAGQLYDVLYLRQGEQKEARHRARQPFGQVPTYEEGELLMFESGAIVLHLAERFGRGLIPSDPAAKARAHEWVFAALNTLEPVIGDYVNCTIFDAGEPWAAARRPVVRQRLDDRLGELADPLGEREWLDGAFTVGDLIMVCALRSVPPKVLAGHPSLAAYVARGEARPAFARALEAQLAGFTGEPSAEVRAWMEQFEAKQKQGETA